MGYYWVVFFYAPSFFVRVFRFYVCWVFVLRDGKRSIFLWVDTSFVSSRLSGYSGLFGAVCSVHLCWRCMHDDAFFT